MPTLAVKAYAKINLGLSVLGVRADGYHELRTVYQSISLADDLSVRLAGRAGTVRLETSGWEVPAGAGNLAVRAAEAITRELEIRSGVALTLHKRIPPGSGLGGASSDAAAILRAVPALSRRSLPAARLLRIAAELGSDVPFFLTGGRALGVGRGEEVYPLADSPRRSVVVFFPGEGMSTAEAYRLLRRSPLTPEGARPTIELFAAAQLSGNAADGLGSMPGNDFEPLLLKRVPQLARAKRVLLANGAQFASLSGSGSALFGIFQDPAQSRRAAREIKKILCQSSDSPGGDSIGGDSAARSGVYLARTVSRREFQQLFASKPRSR